MKLKDILSNFVAWVIYMLTMYFLLVLGKDDANLAKVLASGLIFIIIFIALDKIILGKVFKQKNNKSIM